MLVGTIDLKNGGTHYKVAKYITHEGYNSPQFANDIALIKVANEIEFNEKVQPIELAKEEVPDGAELTLTGWGLLEVGLLLIHFYFLYGCYALDTKCYYYLFVQAWGALPTILQVIKLNAVQTERCRQIYGGKNVHDSHICTFTKVGEGACNVSKLYLHKKL